MYNVYHRRIHILHYYDNYIACIYLKDNTTILYLTYTFVLMATILSINPE